MKTDNMISTAVITGLLQDREPELHVDCCLQGADEEGIWPHQQQRRRRRRRRKKACGGTSSLVSAFVFSCLLWDDASLV
jgi:hypothetical protein